MKMFARLLVFVLLLSSAGVASAADVTVVEPFPEGSLLNPVDSGDTLIFGDIQARIISNETDADGNRTVQLEIVNDSRASFWVEPTHLKSFDDGRFSSDGKYEDGDHFFRVTSMETTSGKADIAYEWHMTISPGGSGTVTLEIDPGIEKMCFQPFVFSADFAGLVDEEMSSIHGCWLLGDVAN